MTRKKSDLKSVIDARRTKDLPVDFTPDEILANPSIPHPDIDAEGMRLYLIEKGKIDDYFTWKFSQEEFTFIKNQFNIDIHIKESTEKIVVDCLQSLMPGRYAKLYDLLRRPLGETKEIIRLPFKLVEIVDFFNQLHRNHFIRFTNLHILANWLSVHIQYRSKDKYYPIFESQAYEVLTEKKRQTLAPLIKIVDGQIIIRRIKVKK